jgi:hypothetical protein
VSLRKAINDYCKGCIYDSLAPGTWMKQVEDCSSPDCELYPVRPKPRPVRPKPRSRGDSDADIIACSGE